MSICSANMIQGNVITHSLLFPTDAVSDFINEDHWEQEHSSSGSGFPDSPAGLVRFGVGAVVS